MEGQSWSKLAELANKYKPDLAGNMMANALNRMPSILLYTFIIMIYLYGLDLL